MGSHRYTTQEETLSHPAYPSTVFVLKPRFSGLCPVAADRPGGPLQIAYSIHGRGPIKVLFLIGLGGTQASWQRQTLHFGHINASKYTVLTIDNRGMGESSAPLSRYSTSEMAKDVIEVLDFLSWTSPRSVHLVGISLGGMICQELTLFMPYRFASVSFISTAPEMANTGGVSESLGRAGMIIPKSLEQAILDTGKQLFPEEWMLDEDDCLLPDPAIHPDVKAPPTASSRYERFSNNFQRFQAQELVKRLSPRYTRVGFMMQLVAAGWHKKSPEQLKDLAEKVGRERILVFHGKDDNMISPILGKRLADALKPSTEVFAEGLGHAALLQRTSWFNAILEKHFAEGERINREGPSG